MTQANRVLVYCRRHLRIVGCLLIAGGTLTIAALLRDVAPARVQAFITGCKYVGSNLVVSAVATNIGREVVLYNGSPPFSVARWKSEGRVVDTEPSYVSKRATFGFLKPGSSQAYIIQIPREAQSVRFGCYFETVGPRGRCMAWLIDSGLWNRAYPVSEWLIRVVPLGRRQMLEVWSEETVVATSE
jgi:hypothetical protein